MTSYLRFGSASVFVCLVTVLVTAQTPAPQTPDHGTHGTPGATASGGDHADHFARRFDNAAEWAREFDDPARDAWQLPARVIDALGIRPGQVVADIGAGTGYFTVRLAQTPARPKVYAVDIEPSMVAHIRQRAAAAGLTNVVGVVAGADRTNLPEAVDLALIVDTYHHIPNRVGYFTALRAALKPGGRIAIVDFKKGSPSGPPEEFRFTPEQITAELAKAGLSLQATHDFLPRQLFLVFGVN
jgi:SAM-dependent methyltransferase